jgi:hypothetical protein
MHAAHACSDGSGRAPAGPPPPWAPYAISSRRLIFATALTLRCIRSVQSVRIGNMDVRATMAAMPRFVSSRRTDNPTFVFVFMLGANVLLVLLFVVAAVHMHGREPQRAAAALQAEQQRLKLTEAAREAHEKTIAYACHQLRYVKPTRDMVARGLHVPACCAHRATMYCAVC